MPSPRAGWPVNDGDLVTYSWLNAVGFRKLWDTTEAGVVFPVASVTTPTLGSAYSSLLVVWTGRTSQAVALDALAWRFNGSAAASYYSQSTSGVGATLSSGENLAATSAQVGILTGASSHNAGDFGDGAIWFPAFNSTGFVFCQAISTGFTNTTTGTGRVQHYGAYFAGSGMTSAQFLPQGGGNFVSGTRFTLYGVL